MPHLSFRASQGPASPGGRTASSHRPLWAALLVASSVAFTLGLACAVPLAAFAAVAALTMNRTDALVTIGLVWFANQCAGFGLLGYPWTVESVGWGLGLGVIGLAAAELARRGAGPGHYAGAHHADLMASTGAFATAFVVYEGAVLAGCWAVGTCAEAMEPTVIGRIFLINAASFVGLMVVDRLAGLIGPAGAPTGGTGMTASHA